MAQPATKRKPPAQWPGALMVEAAGQLVWLFRARLDYAITSIGMPIEGGACYPTLVALPSVRKVSSIES
jgi:hypothetical protein